MLRNMFYYRVGMMAEWKIICNFVKKLPYGYRTYPTHKITLE